MPILGGTRSGGDANGDVTVLGERLEQAYDVNYAGFDRTVDAHIKNLRRKIEPDPRNPQYILTIYGVGYKFADTIEPATGSAAG